MYKLPGGYDMLVDAVVGMDGSEITEQIHICTGIYRGNKNEPNLQHMKWHSVQDAPAKLFYHSTRVVVSWWDHGNCHRVNDNPAHIVYDAFGDVVQTTYLQRNRLHRIYGPAYTDEHSNIYYLWGKVTPLEDIQAFLVRHDIPSLDALKLVPALEASFLLEM